MTIRRDILFSHPVWNAKFVSFRLPLRIEILHRVHERFGLRRLFFSTSEGQRNEGHQGCGDDNRDLSYIYLSQLVR